MLTITDAEAADRLLDLHRMQILEHRAGKRVILYSLEAGKNGGGNPGGDTPDVAPGGVRTFTSDCIGTGLWGAGVDRYQPKRFAHLYGGYMNTNSILLDAHGERAVRHVGSDVAPMRLWRPCTVPRRGVFAVYASRFTKAGVKVPGSWGHIMGVVGVRAAEWDPNAPSWDLLDVVHCHGGVRGRTERAIDLETAASAMGRAAVRAHLVELIR